jgi:chemotaxis signal transduction protein
VSELSEQLLDERAKMLARPAEDHSAQSVVQVLRLSVGEHEYALRAGYVDGVVRWADWTRVPGAPGIALGVLAWRGAIVVVLDLASALGQETSDFQHVVVLHKEGRRIGLAVTQIEGVASVAGGLGDAIGVSPRALRLVEGVLHDGVALLQAESLLEVELLRAL